MTEPAATSISTNRMIEMMEMIAMNENFDELADDWSDEEDDEDEDFPDEDEEE